MELSAGWHAPHGIDRRPALSRLVLLAKHTLSHFLDQQPPVLSAPGLPSCLVPALTLGDHEHLYELVMSLNFHGASSRFLMPGLTIPPMLRPWQSLFLDTVSTWSLLMM